MKRWKDAHSCDNCRYHEPNQCRRYAPKIRTTDDDYYAESGKRNITVFPYTQANWYCGEWESEYED